MSAAAWAQLALLVVVLAISIPLLGGYMAKVYGNAKAPGDRVFLPVERLIYRICRVDPDQEQRWTVYAFSVLAFSVVGLLILYAMQRLQASLPLNPTHAPQVGEALSFNTATSFTSNTNWQSYAGESTLSHLTQMAGLTVQNFVSAAAGMAVMAALIRGLARRRANTDRELLGRPHSHDAAHPAPDRVRRRPDLRRHRASSRTSTASRWSRRSRATPR